MMVQRTEAEPDSSGLRRRRSNAGATNLKISIGGDDGVRDALNNAISYRETDCDSIAAVLKYCRGSPSPIRNTLTPRLGVHALEKGSALQVPTGSALPHLPSPRYMLYNERSDDSTGRGLFSFPSQKTTTNRSKLSPDNSGPLLGTAAKSCFLLGAFNKAYTVESMSTALLKKDQAKGEMFTPTYTVVFLGELSVGKSALCKKFFRSGMNTRRSSDERRDSEFGFDEEEDLHSPVTPSGQDSNSTTVDSHHVYERPVTVDGHCVRLRILDINAEKHRTECGDCGDFEPYLEAGDAYALTYSVADRGTFKTVMEILSRMSRLHADRMQTLPIILVGNKCDLVRKRQVTTASGVKLAAKYDIKVIETSASLNQNVTELFEGVIQQIRLRQDEIALKNSPGMSNREVDGAHGGFSSIGDSESQDATASSTSSKRSSSVRKKRRYKRVFTRRLTEFLGGGEKDVKTQRAKSCQDLSIL